MGPGPRRLAGHAPGPVHRGDARRRPLHGRRSPVLHGTGRRSEHAVARRRRAPAPPRSVRLGAAQAGGGRPLHRRRRARGTPAGRRPGAERPGRDPARPRRAARGERGGRCARARGYGTRRAPGVVRRDRGRGRPRLGRRRDRAGCAGGDGCPRPPRRRDDRARCRRAARRDGHAGPGRGGVQRGGHDVRWDRDQRGHDDQPVLAPADQPRSMGGGRARIARWPRTPSRSRCASSRPRGVSTATRPSMASWAARRSGRATS